MELLVNTKSAKHTLILQIFYESTVAAERNVFWTISVQYCSKVNDIGVQDCNIVAASLMHPHPLPLPPWGDCV